MKSSPTMIRHFDDRIEISNSGPLPAQVTVDNIKNEQFTRNVRIARTLHDLGYVRELNEGVKRIYSSMQELMLESPEYRQDNNNVILTLRNRIAEHKETISAEVMERVQAHWYELSNTQQAIINLLTHSNNLSLRTILRKRKNDPPPLNSQYSLKKSML